MPTPLRAAAIVPATWVPWSLVVGYHPVAEVSGRPASVQLTESATSMLAARSGWSGSMPLSRTPTRTLREPSVILWAWSALIIVRSHCSPSRGSVAAAGDVSDSRSPLVGLLRALLVAGRASAPGRPRDLWRALGDGDGAGRPDGVDGVAALRDDVGAEGRDLRVRDDDADLRPRLDDDAAGGPDRRLDEARLAGVGDAGVDDVAHELAVGRADGDGRRDRLGRGSVGRGDGDPTDGGGGGEGERRDGDDAASGQAGVSHV